MEFNLYHSNYHNCYNIVLSSLLQRQGVNVVRLWTQSGLSYYHHNGFGLSPYYRPIMEDIKKLGLTLHEELYNDIDKYFSSILELLKRGLTVGVNTNIFDLPYSPHYKRLHEIHALEILSIKNEDTFIIADHYYKYYGEIKKNKLREAFLSTIKNSLANSLSLVFLESQVKNYTYPNVSEILKENFQALEGKNLTEYQLNNVGIYGIKALTYFKEKLEKALSNEDENTVPLLIKYHKQTKEVANSRHNFYQYLNNVNLTPELSDLVLESAQNFTVTTNMILRVLAIKEFVHNGQRVINRVNKALACEEKILKKLNELLIT